ncbi:hypothetical protein SNEBB_006886 [Seison nebaliae]|nr:hypothetical protein SNEBB_006886 [Seison nebaliae]
MYNGTTNIFNWKLIIILIFSLSLINAANNRSCHKCLRRVKRTVKESAVNHYLSRLPIVKYNGSSGPDTGEYPHDIISVKLRRRGLVVLHVIGLFYMFIALAMVCDEFFVPSLDVICETLVISDDVAGATFMAAGGSAPELFTSFIGTFVARSNVGVGTIVGSAVFNILFVIGTCAMVSKEILQLTWWPLARDCFFYSLDLILLIIFFTDERIDWYESTILFLMYLVYVSFMAKNDQIGTIVRSCYEGNNKVANVEEEAEEDRNATRYLGIQLDTDKLESSPSKHAATEYLGATITQIQIPKLPIPLREIEELELVVDPPPPPPDLSRVSVDSSDLAFRTDAAYSGIQKERFKSSTNASLMETDEEENEPLDLTWPDTFFERVNYILLAPIMYLLWFHHMDWFIYLFYGMVGESDWGNSTSVPDLITSVLVARKGLGDMAVSSSIGSNIFDVTVGLPIPWIIFALVYNGRAVNVESEGMFCAMILLFAMLVAVITTISCSNWKMKRSFGVTMFCLYFIFLSFSLLLEYSIIPCPTIKM